MWHVVHLKSLTLKGFKSFASPTTLRFEPGITCVVGPNGSGKSNVVDALTWVMGEQGAKTLRGGKMEDVIFAGTSSRAPLGRAEVTVTIDNSDNALPIEYSEVSITRRMFRDGASEYEINGSSCRLMDVQELLSDSGIGREMHVIVGQGKLAEILESRPEDRRAFIEEAAGVLKHRKRKEKAVRKLDSMSANLARLTDLTTELRRQLKPLGRQAEMARRAQTIQADLRDARLRLAADDLVTRKAEFDNTNQAETTLRREHDELTARLEAKTVELNAHEVGGRYPQRARRGRPADLVPAVGAGRTGQRDGAHRQRARPASRHRTRSVHRPRPRSPRGCRPRRSPTQERQLLDELAESRTRLEAARTELTERERVAAEAERAHLAAARAEADRREGLARLAGQVDTMRTRVESIDETVARLSVGIEEAAAKAQQMQAEFETVQGRVGELDAGEVGLDEHHDRTVAALRLADERVAELQAAERGAERQVASLRARIEALSVGLDRKDGAAWLQKNHGGAGLFGSIANLLKVRPGYEAAVAAVLGAAADAVAAENFGAARSAVAALKESDGGRAAIVLGDWPHRATPPTEQLPYGAAWAVHLVEAPSRLQGAITAMLSGVAVVPDLTAALDLVAARPQLRAVTTDGDLVGAGWVSGGSDRKPSTLEITSEVEKARAELADCREAGRRAVRRIVRCAGRAGVPPGRRRAGTRRAQRIRCRDLGDLRATRQARAGRPRRRRRVAAAHPAAQRAGGRPQPNRRGTRPTRAAAAQRPAGADVRSATRRPPGVDGRGRTGPSRRGGGAAGCAHRRRTRECRSRAGGFAATGGGGRTRGPAACAARARGTRTRRGGSGRGSRVRTPCRAAAERGGGRRIPRPRRGRRRTPAPGRRADEGA